MMSEKQPILSVRGLKKRFGDQIVLNGIDLDVFAGQVVVLIGSSGSGKSTLLRCLNFLERPYAGSITFGRTALCQDSEQGFKILPERELRAVRAHMPMVFQQFNLFSHKTVLQNVIEGPVVVLRRLRSTAIAEAKEVLARFGLGEKQDAYPGELSGGQQQRVAIVRAVMMQPKLILFDEPTSALDPELVAGVQAAIQSLAAEGMTMVIVTHEMGFARKLADRIHFMAGGRIEESGTPGEIFASPQSARLKSFVASMLH
jgi:ABC-type histidine transport system ATPase subunit